VRVPRQLLRELILVEDFGGSGARGPLFEAREKPVRASVQPTMKLFTDASGQQYAIDALVIIRPEDGPVRPESKITARGEKYRVVRTYPMPDERRPSHYELAVSKWFPQGGAGSGS